MRGEALIACWPIFATSIGLRASLMRLRQPELNEVFLDEGYLRIASASLRCLPDVVRVALRSRAMSQPWPWPDYESPLDRRLCNIGAERGVRVLR